MSNKPDSEKRKTPVYNLILHLHPRKIRLSTIRFNLTFGLGGMAALLIVIQVFTGLLLKFHYLPVPQYAYDSILKLNTDILFGRLAHNLHHWSAIFLLWIVFFHMLRVLFTGAYHKPRHTGWIFGVLLLLLVILSNFTGYLLPWDQLSYWAITISTTLLEYVPVIGSYFKETLLGGSEVGRDSLSNFFNLHTGIIPLLIILLMAFHFWRIRRSGGVIYAESEKESPMVDVQPHLVAREFVVALVLIAVLLFISALFDAPLRERANPGFSPNPAKAPWYFMGIQELLIHFHPFFAIVVFPITILVSAFWLPFIKMNEQKNGIWFLSKQARKAGVYAIISSFIFSTLFILLSEILPDPEKILLSIPAWISLGIIPFILVGTCIYIFLRIVQNKFSLDRAESIQTLIIIIFVSYSIFSIVGIFFRGEGMKLMWPWQI